MARRCKNGSTNCQRYLGRVGQFTPRCAKCEADYRSKHPATAPKTKPVIPQTLSLEQMLDNYHSGKGTGSEMSADDAARLTALIGYQRKQTGQ
jgi:hypothetical protein